LLLPSIEKDKPKTFQNNFQITQGWKRERGVAVCLLENYDNDGKDTDENNCSHVLQRLLLQGLRNRPGIQ
jgi:hypothetical protein